MEEESVMEEDKKNNFAEADFEAKSIKEGPRSSAERVSPHHRILLTPEPYYPDYCCGCRQWGSLLPLTVRGVISLNATFSVYL